jgi:hypothetical protein
MHQIRTRFIVFSLSDTEFLREHKKIKGKLAIVDNAEDASRFANADEALDYAEKYWLTYNKFNYNLAPRLAAARIEQVEIVRQIAMVYGFPRSGATPAKVINPGGSVAMQRQGSAVHEIKRTVDNGNS